MRRSFFNVMFWIAVIGTVSFWGVAAYVVQHFIRKIW